MLHNERRRMKPRYDADWEPLLEGGIIKERACASLIGAGWRSLNYLPGDGQLQKRSLVTVLSGLPGCFLFWYHWIQAYLSEFLSVHRISTQVALVYNKLWRESFFFEKLRNETWLLSFSPPSLRVPSQAKFQQHLTSTLPMVELIYKGRLSVNYSIGRK